MKEAYLYEKLKNNKVKCLTCNHFCQISEGQRGICGVRENKKGKLYLLVYGKAVAENIDPIEKKPLYHFMPGTFSYSIAAMGCNFRCGNCQNWQISQLSKQTKKLYPHTFKDAKGEGVYGEDLPPEEIVKRAIESDCPSISYTYTEPTIFLEYCLDTMKLARQKGLKNVWVSNGYMSKQTLELITPYLDAINVDLKTFDNEKYIKNCGARLQPILDNLIAIKKTKIHLEVTTLVIPTFNDSKEELESIAKFIAEKLSVDTPWHISRFFPQYELYELPPTPIETLKMAEKIGKEAGLKYVHLGNI
jgi:pyruvate formate lyase activating enzyme